MSYGQGPHLPFNLLLVRTGCGRSSALSSPRDWGPGTLENSEPVTEMPRGGAIRGQGKGEQPGRVSPLWTKVVRLVSMTLRGRL